MQTFHVSVTAGLGFTVMIKNFRVWVHLKMIAHLESLVIHPEALPLITDCSTASPLAADDALREDKRGVRVHVCVCALHAIFDSLRYFSYRGLQYLHTTGCAESEAGWRKSPTNQGASNAPSSQCLKSSAHLQRGEHGVFEKHR
jgi:hypothetical protein